MLDIENLRKLNSLENIEPKQTFSSSQELEDDAQLFHYLTNKTSLTKLERIQLRNLLEGPVNASFSGEENRAEAILAKYDINDQPVARQRKSYTQSTQIEEDAITFKEIMGKRVLRRHDRKILENLVNGPTNAYFCLDREKARDKINRNIKNLLPLEQ